MKIAIAMSGDRTIPEVVERVERYVDLSKDTKRSPSVTDTENMMQQREQNYTRKSRETWQ